jgi:hypothetical protein
MSSFRRAARFKTAAVDPMAARGAAPSAPAPGNRNIFIDTKGYRRYPPRPMDWPLAIERNRTALLAVAAAAFALLGGREASGPIARAVRSAVLALLRPAEAALRRLILVAARGLAPVARSVRPAPAIVAGAAPGAGPRMPAFPLFDPLKRFGPPPPIRPLGIPRIRTFWASPALVPSSSPPAQPIVLPQRPDPDALVDGGSVRLRLLGFERALADLPRQAKRLARHRARAIPRWPLRPGRPPGHRQRPGREVDHILRECHALAMDARGADTS